MNARDQPRISNLMPRPESLVPWIPMATGLKAVSKRSARTYVEDGSEKDTVRSRKMSTYEDATGDDAGNKSSISTATSQGSQSSPQTSLEVSPMVLAASGDPSVETIPLDALDRNNAQDINGMFRSVQGYNAFRSPGPHEVLPPAGRPLNFGIVVPGVYRSSFPQAGDHEFIEALRLKTVVTLVRKDFPEGYQAFINKNGIRHHVFDMKGTKKEEIPIKTMKSILRLVLDRQNHPLLIHCNHGKHRTGCVVGVVRKVSGWDLNNILDEYRSYAEPKVRECDIKYITGFQLIEISNLFRNPGWQHRTRNFLKATLFAFVVLAIWLFSGSRMVEGPKRKLIK